MPGGDRAVLERADHLEAGPVADVGEPRVRVAAERPLQDAAVRGPVEDGAPVLELADAVGRLLRVELGHARVVQVACRRPSCRGSGPATSPPGRRGPSAAATPPSAMTVCALPSSDLQTSPTSAPAALRRDRRPQPGPARADHEDVVRARLGTCRFGHRVGPRRLEVDRRIGDHARSRPAARTRRPA